AYDDMGVRRSHGMGTPSRWPQTNSEAPNHAMATATATESSEFQRRRRILGGAGRAGRDECCVRWVQPFAANRLGVRNSPRREAITIVVGVPTQLHVPHGLTLPRDVMPYLTVPTSS